MTSADSTRSPALERAVGDQRHRRGAPERAPTLGKVICAVPNADDHPALRVLVRATRKAAVTSMKSRDVVRYAQEHGWTFLRHGKGSHEVYAHPNFDYVLVIPMHGSKEIGPGLLAKLLKQIDGTWR